MTVLAESFIKSRGEPVPLGDDLVHMATLLDAFDTPEEVLLRFIRGRKDPPQGLRLKVSGGSLEINGEATPDAILWADTAPSEVIALVRPSVLSQPATLLVWNAWRTPSGRTDAWVGDAGMLVEPSPNGTVVLRCSDGSSPPSFDDLVVEVVRTPVTLNRG